MIERRGNLYETVQGKFRVAALREPLFFPCLVGFKKPTPVEQIGAPRNSRIHTRFIVA